MARKIKSGEPKKKEKVMKSEEISPDKYFMLRDGTPIKSIHELAMQIDRMSDEDFSFHVNEGKNDFSNWINDVFGQHKLAEGLKKTTCKKESQIYLLKHMVSGR